MSYRQPETFFVRDECGPGEVTPWPLVEEALRRAGISAEEWDAAITTTDTVTGPYTRVPFVFCWLGGTLVAQRTGAPPPWRSGAPIIPGQTVAYIVVGFMTTADGVFTEHFGNMGSAEDAEKLAARKTAEYEARPYKAYRSSDTRWEYKPAKVVLL